MDRSLKIILNSLFLNKFRIREEMIVVINLQDIALALLFSFFLFLLLSFATMSDDFYVSSDLLIIASDALLRAIILTLVNLGLAEPLFNFFLKLSALDESEIHWWPRLRHTSRKMFIVLQSVCSIFGIMLGSILFWSKLGLIPWLSLFCLSNLFYFVNLTKILWNHTAIASINLVLPPVTLMYFYISTNYTDLHVIYSLFLLFASIASLLINKSFSIIAIKRKIFFSRLPENEEEFYNLLESIHQAGAQFILNDWISKNQKDFNDLLPLKRLQIFNAAGLFEESLDFGLVHYPDLQTISRFHIILAEASLASNDPENCIAHAEEAIELSGGSLASHDGIEANLMLALGSFALWEVDTASAACSRLLSLKAFVLDSKKARILKETRSLIRKYGPMIYEE